MLTMICVVVRMRCEKVSDTEVEREREGSKERKKEKRDEQHFDEQQPKL